MDHRHRGIVLGVVSLLTIAQAPQAAGQGDATARDPDAQSTILILAIDDFTRPYMRLMLETFTDAVSTAAGPAIYFESIDASRFFQEPHYLEDLQEWLRRKYRGRRIDLILPIPAQKFTTLVFDDRQLERWRIPVQSLPPGSDIRFRAPSLWRDRRGLVLTVVGVTLLQSLLIAGFVFERQRRRRAEIESRRNLVAMAHLDRRGHGRAAKSLAHELNQPLNAILQNAGVAEMILTRPPQLQERDEMLDIITDIRKDDIRASEIIRRMRGLLQKRELETHPVDLNQVADETVTIVRPDARARQVQLEVDLGNGVGAISGDRVHLQQVMLNLLMNALDAVATMPPERRRVRVRTNHSASEVQVSVSDTGVGIPTGQTSDIFEPFYTTKPEGSGMGMGLAISRSIIEAHGGRIAAQNDKSGGATVWFSVPISPRPAASSAPNDQT